MDIIYNQLKHEISYYDLHIKLNSLIGKWKYFINADIINWYKQKQTNKNVKINLK